MIEKSGRHGFRGSVTSIRSLCHVGSRGYRKSRHVSQKSPFPSSMRLLLCRCCWVKALYGSLTASGVGGRPMSPVGSGRAPETPPEAVSGVMQPEGRMQVLRRLRIGRSCAPAETLIQLLQQQGTPDRASVAGASGPARCQSGVLRCESWVAYGVGPAEGSGMTRRRLAGGTGQLPVLRGVRECPGSTPGEPTGFEDVLPAVRSVLRPFREAKVEAQVQLLGNPRGLEDVLPAAGHWRLPPSPQTRTQGRSSGAIPGEPTEISSLCMVHNLPVRVRHRAGCPALTTLERWRRPRRRYGGSNPQQRTDL